MIKAKLSSDQDPETEYPKLIQGVRTKKILIALDKEKGVVVFNGSANTLSIGQRINEDLTTDSYKLLPKGQKVTLENV